LTGSEKACRRVSKGMEQTMSKSAGEPVGFILGDSTRGRNNDERGWARKKKNGRGENGCGSVDQIVPTRETTVQFLKRGEGRSFRNKIIKPQESKFGAQNSGRHSGGKEKGGVERSDVGEETEGDS